MWDETIQSTSSDIEKNPHVEQLPSGWKVVELGRIISKYLDFRGKTPLKIGMNWGEGEIPALSANNVEMGKINLEKESYLGSEMLYQKWMNKGDCSRGDIVITMEAPLGNIAQIPDDRKYILSQRVILLKTEKNILSDWLAYKLSHSDFQKDLYKHSTGSTVLGIQQKKLNKLKISYPLDLNEQRKIADIIRTTDTVIESTQTLIAKYEQIKQGMMQDLFTCGVDENGRIRPFFSESPHLYINSPLGMIPREWKIVTIEQIGSKEPYAIVDGPFGSNLKSEHYRERGVPVIQSGFVTSGEFKALEYVYVDETLFDIQKRSAVRAGDIVMAKIGAQCGTCALLPYEHKLGILAGNSLKISTNQEICQAKYLLFLLHFYYKKGVIDNIKTETAQPAISLKNLRKMRICLPSLREQTMIIKSILEINNILKNEQIYLKKLNNVKLGLMQDLLIGKVRLKIDEQMVTI